jgi:hypothetical protein
MRLPRSARGEAGAGRIAKHLTRTPCRQKRAAPIVLLMAPPPVGLLTDLKGMLEGAEAKSRAFHHWYRLFAGRIGYAYVDTADVIVSSPIDGIHWEASEHATLGRAVETITSARPPQHHCQRQRCCWHDAHAGPAAHAGCCSALTRPPQHHCQRPL